MGLAWTAGGEVVQGDGRSRDCPECDAVMEPQRIDAKAVYFVCPECGCRVRVERNRDGLQVGDLDLYSTYTHTRWLGWDDDRPIPAYRCGGNDLEEIYGNSV